jgi:hypothetical protein
MAKAFLRKILQFVGYANQLITRETNDQKLLALGTLLSNQQWSMNSTDINDYEFKIFSEWGDDGIIQYLIKHIAIENKTFIEFGVENYMESNTRFLLMNNNWCGFVMDGSEQNMKSLQKRSWFFRYELNCKAAWIDKNNINSLLEESRLANIGLLHIDLDGNDYFILKEIDFTRLNPSILIMEYNSVFGYERAISVPYKSDFNRTRAHYSNLFFGASLAALNFGAEQKGYSLIGCNLAGNNAYFVRNDLLSERIQKVSVAQSYKPSRFREGRTKNYQLSYLSGAERIEAIKGLDVFNVITNQPEKL